MSNDSFDAHAQPGQFRINHRDVTRDMPSREELLARNSFGSPNDNKYLNNPRAAEKACKFRQIEQLKAEVMK